MLLLLGLLLLLLGFLLLQLGSLLLQLGLQLLRSCMALELQLLHLLGPLLQVLVLGHQSSLKAVKLTLHLLSSLLCSALLQMQLTQVRLQLLPSCLLLLYLRL